MLFLLHIQNSNINSSKFLMIKYFVDHYYLWFPEQKRFTLSVS